MPFCMSGPSSLPTKHTSADLIAAVVLAAGGSKRLGRAKQTLRLDGKTLLELVISRLLPLVHQTYVVVGSRAAEVVASADKRRVEIIENPDWAQGMSTSIQAGIRALGSSYEAVLIAACDQPLIQAEHYDALLTRWRDEPAGPVATDYANGTVGIPAVFPASSFAELMTLTGDRGARRLLLGANSIVNSDARHDVDTQADYDALVTLPAERRSKDL